MDIEKEREAFEAYMSEKYKNLMDRRQCLNNGGGYMAWDMNVAWKVWQAAKAQAVPDGYKVVPVNYECVWCGCTELDGWTDETMIEALEPVNAL